MEIVEYQRMFEAEKRHWWFQGRLAAIERILAKYAAARPARLLDIGCGTGMFLERRQGDFGAAGLDFSREALEFSRRRGVRQLVRGDSQRLPFASDSFDVLTAFDLIEHVPNDGQLVAEAHRVLKRGGRFIASVPAHPFLWSAHDVALHHYRRYRWNEFDRLFDPAKWRRLRMTRMFAAIFPPAALIRGARRLLPANGKEAKADTVPTAEWLNRALINWHKLEAAWIERFNAPMGLSILTVREKI